MHSKVYELTETRALEPLWQTANVKKFVTISNSTSKQSSFHTNFSTTNNKQQTKQLLHKVTPKATMKERIHKKTHILQHLFKRSRSLRRPIIHKQRVKIVYKLMSKSKTPTSRKGLYSTSTNYHL